MSRFCFAGETKDDDDDDGKAVHMSRFCFAGETKIRLLVSSESSAGQRIHMKNQALFSLKDKSKKLKCRLLQFLIAALRVNLF